MVDPEVQDLKWRWCVIFNSRSHGHLLFRILFAGALHQWFSRRSFQSKITSHYSLHRSGWPDSSNSCLRSLELDEPSLFILSLRNQWRSLICGLAFCELHLCKLVREKRPRHPTRFLVVKRKFRERSWCRNYQCAHFFCRSHMGVYILRDRIILLIHCNSEYVLPSRASRGSRDSNRWDWRGDEQERGDTQEAYSDRVVEIGRR